MEWTDDKVLELIEEYKALPVIWDPKNAEYKLLHKKNEGWRLLAEVMRTSVDEVKKKINSLLASFRRERSREKQRSGMAGNEVYKSSWFAYKSMTFLIDKFKVKEEKSSEGQSNEEEIMNYDIEINTPESGNFLDNACTIQPQKLNKFTRPHSYLKRKANTGSVPFNQSKFKKPDVQLKDVVDIVKTVCDKISAHSSQTHKSSDDVFGEYVASKMRGYPHNTKSFVQHKINTVLFEADLGMYEQPPTGHTDPNVIPYTSPTTPPAARGASDF